MYIDTDGIILKLTRTADNRRIVLLFSRNYGKISAGSSIPEKGKGRTSLAMKPFTHGRYELFKGRDTYHVNGAEVIRSYYGIGENVEKFLNCSYVLEFTEKILPEGQPAPALLDLLLDFLSMMEKRPRKFLLLVLAYQIKALQIVGCAPCVNGCAACGANGSDLAFSIVDGGLICGKCAGKAKNNGGINDPLIYQVDFGIVDIIRYIMDHSLVSLEKLALDDESLAGLKAALTRYIRYHMDIGDLKSEAFLTDRTDQ